jgi:hypothetical protein
MEVIVPLLILQDHLSPKEAVEVEVDLVVILVQQEMLVEHLLPILAVDLVEVRKDLRGEPLIEVVVAEHTEIQDLSGEIQHLHQLILTVHTLEVVEEEQDLVVLIIPLNLMVEMEKLTLGVYLHGEMVIPTLVVAVAVEHVREQLDLVAVLQEEVQLVQILLLVLMLTRAVAAAVDQVVVQQSMAHLEDLVLL